MKVELTRVDDTDLPALLPLIAGYHDFEGIASDAAGREAAARALLARPEFGAIWLVRADARTAGYIALCQGFSLEFGGFDAFVDEFFLLPEFRGRGIGGRVLELIRGEARARGINALHLEVERDNAPARRLYEKAGFEARERYVLMSTLIDDD